MQAATGINNAGAAISTSADTLSFDNSGSGAVNISNDKTVSVSGSNAGSVILYLTAGDLDVAAGGITSNGNTISLFADAMTFTGSINAGAADVILSSNDTTIAIQLGAASSGTILGITEAMLDEITTTTGVTIGDAYHEGGITVVGDVTISSTAALDLISQGEVAANATLTTGGDTTLLSTAANVTLGAGGAIISDGSILLQSTTADVTFGAGASLTSNASSITLDANSSITGSGALTINAATDLIFNKALVIDGATDIAAGTLNVQSDITTTTGSLSLTSAGSIIFNPDITVTAADALSIDAVASGSGNLTLNAGSDISLLQNLTVNGLATLDAGAGLLTIDGAFVTEGDNDIVITTNDLDLNGTMDSAGGSIVINDAGNSIGLGSNQAGRLNIDITEFQAITGAGLTLSTTSDITIEGSFVSASTVPLTLDAATITMPTATTLSLASGLDIVDSALTASSSLNIDVTGAFAMNNTINANGVVTIAADSVTMGEPSSITSSNNQIDITANTGDILLGLVDAGTGNVNLTATIGDVLNNNGVFTNITDSLTNIKATSTTITAGQRLGASSTDAITIDTSRSGLITLDFVADTAYINNLQSTRIVNNGTGDVAIGLIFSNQIIGVGHNVGLGSQQAEGAIDYQDEVGSFISVLGEDYNLSEVEEDVEDSSTLNAIVPVMIRTQDGWEFKAPLGSPVNQEGKERKVDWLLL